MMSSDKHDHDAPKDTARGIAPNEEHAMDKALQAEDEKDDAAASAEVLDDRAETSDKPRDTP